MSTPRTRAAPEPTPDHGRDTGLIAEHTRTGQWLFRWRGYMPMAPVACLLVATALDPTTTGGEGWTAYWIGLGLALGTIGLGIRAAALGYTPCGTSGRATRVMRTVSLNTRGLYSLVRHPLYLGNLLLWLGVAAVVGRPTVMLLIALLFWVYYERIMIAEEGYLKAQFGEEFATWAKQTPALFPTRLCSWHPPHTHFDLRSYLGRDHPALYGFVTATFSIQIVREWARTGEWRVSAGWAAYIAAGTGMYLLLRTLKHLTKVLDARNAHE